MYSLYAGDIKEPKVPSFRGRADQIGVLRALLNALQTHIEYDWWYITDNLHDTVVEQPDRALARLWVRDRRR